MHKEICFPKTGGGMHMSKSGGSLALMAVP